MATIFRLKEQKKFAVVIPSQNSTVEYEFNHPLGHPSVTCHIGRFQARKDLSSNDHFRALLGEYAAGIEDTVGRLMTLDPDYMVMGMSLPTFMGGKEGNRKFKQGLQEMCKKNWNIATGAEACELALHKFNARKIAVVTPYQTLGDENVEQYFRDCGFDVANVEGLKRPSAAAIGSTSEDLLIQTFKKFAEIPGVDALVQAGTNMPVVSLADEAERWLGKPVIAINAGILSFFHSFFLCFSLVDSIPVLVSYVCVFLCVCACVCGV